MLNQGRLSRRISVVGLVKTLSTLSVSRPAACVALLALLNSCGWEQKLAFAEPDGNAIVEILQPFPLNTSGIRIVLMDRGQRFKLFEERADTYPTFATVAWTQDRRFVAAFVWRAALLSRSHSIESDINRVLSRPSSPSSPSVSAQNMCFRTTRNLTMKS